MKKAKIFLILTGFVVLVAVLAGLMSCAPEPVSRTEYQKFQAEIQDNVTKVKGNVETLATSVNTLAGVVDEVVEELPKIKDQKEKDLTEIRHQAEIQALQNEAKSVEERQNIEKELLELKLKLAVIEERGKNAYQSQQSQSYPSYPVKILVETDDYYKFIIVPNNTEIIVDGKRVTSHATVWLTAGWHEYWPNSAVSITVTKP